MAIRDDESKASYVKKLRKAAGLSQGYLAFEIGVAESTISKYESGSLRIPPLRISEIEEVCVNGSVTKRKRKSYGEINGEKIGGFYLKMIREKAGYNQRQFAKLVGKEQNDISKYELNKMRISLDFFMKCCVLCDIEDFNEILSVYYQYYKDEFK